MAGTKGYFDGLYGIAAVLVGLGLVATALVFLVGVAVGLAYHPDGLPGLLPVVAGFGAVLLLSIVILIRRPTGPILSIIAVAIGLGLVAFGLYWIAADPGDAIMWACPVVLGIGLAILAFEPKEANDALS